ncbi:PREDICTED: EH domain-containing protein 4-like [Lipotes vexillifer]|uniref:EH domain-containing protein 4-like n=1 Tax=Lipotes vexillifer TaxID=118797 RepID=A0A340XFM0_LIPVE|nr:PREDICTED: EH domain-containing protein 4-like [Lipotes vexillifer]
MFSWLGRQAGGRERAGGADAVQTVTGGLRSLYLRKVLPLEEAYRFHEFHSPALEDADFENKPMILLVGQYSTGKTTFIRYLLEQDFPGMRIGPEPTTDSFIAVMYGETEGSTPGNALVVDPKKPFRKLSRFGNAFLNRFMCSQLPNQVLKSISIIDSPGILSGEKQRISRAPPSFKASPGFISMPFYHRPWIQKLSGQDPRWSLEVVGEQAEAGEETACPGLLSERVGSGGSA